LKVEKYDKLYPQVKKEGSALEKGILKKHSQPRKQDRPLKTEPVSFRSVIRY